MDPYKKLIYLDPPVLNNVSFDSNGNAIPNSGDLEELVVCVRPSNKTKTPIIDAKELSGKRTLINNYAHSGTGYTILHGTINESLHYLNSMTKKQEIKTNDEITIIGLGCIGLTTAIFLAEKGYKNITILGEESKNIPSYRAGALIDAVFEIPDKKLNEKFNRYILETFQEYERIMNDKNHYLNKSVRYVKYYVDKLFQSNTGLIYLAKKGIIPLPKKVQACFKSNKSIIYNLYEFETLIVDVDIFMEQSLNRVKEFGIKVIENKKINSLDEIKSKIIFNCAGMGGFKLNNNQSEEYPICGHALTLKSNLDKGEYIIFLENIIGLENTPLNGPFYFMPRGTRLVGGTFIDNYDGKDNARNSKELNNLVKRSLFLINGSTDFKPKF